MRELLNAFRMVPAIGRYIGGLIIFVVLIYMIAPRIGLGGKEWILVIGVLVVFALFGLQSFIMKRREKSRAKQFEGSLGLQGRQTGVGKEEIREALKELSEKWEGAVRQLRESGLSIYDLPWYLLIGEPQSGKSTTLKNSGLEFPVGTDGLSGSGGTRNCDWWFSNEAVILDTAGRFTFQEDAAPDAHEWNAFLKLLAKHRRQCPINGIIAVIPVTSLVEDPVDVQEAKAKNIRQKLLSLQKELGIRLPVFVLVTKADRILGFTEFCSKLDPIDQRQLFGWSNRESHDQAWQPESFDRTFSEIVSRIHKMRLRFLRSEESSSQVDSLFVFPEELEAIREPLAAYLNTIFASSRYEEPFLLRGYYITSGVQQGRPIARACRDLLRVRAGGDPQGVLEDLEQLFNKSRAFFIRDFYERKLFPEQGLVTRTRAALAKERKTKMILLGVALPLALIFVVMFGVSASILYNTVGRINDAVAQAKTCLGEDAPCSVSESYELVETLEEAKAQLRRRQFALLMFFRGGRSNEISQDLLPEIQAELLRRGVLQPVVSSFNRRAELASWETIAAAYPAFRDGYAQLLRLDELDRAVLDPQRQDTLRRNLSIEPLLEYCQATNGADSSDTGRQVDEWLAADSRRVEDTERIFQHVVSATPRIADVEVTSLRSAARAMTEYWSISNLARWDFTLIDRYFGGFVGSFGQILDLAPAMAPEARAELDRFLEIGEAMDQAFTQGAEHMTSPRMPPGSDRPGLGIDEWIEFCHVDHEMLQEIAPEAIQDAAVDALCDGIPAEWDRLLARREQYVYLYTEAATTGVGTTSSSTGDDGTEASTAIEQAAASVPTTGGPALQWSEDAGKVHAAVTDLMELVRADAVSQQQEGFQQTLRTRAGREQELDEIASFTDQQTQRFGAWSDQLSGLRTPELSGYEAIGEVAALGLGITVLPPVEGFFLSDVFPETCPSCFYEDYAKTNVPPANSVLTWASDVLGGVSRQVDLRSSLDAIDDSVYDYLETFVAQARGSGGGGGGQRYNRPRSAAETARWSDFVAEVRDWTPVVQLRRSGGGSASLEQRTMDEFARRNRRLQPLASRLRSSSSRSSSGSSGPPISSNLDRAIQTFRGCLGALDDRPLEAWRQLVNGQDASLADFHAFSRNRGLRDDREAQWLVDNLERHGARLLSEAIAPSFEDQLDKFWDDVDYCCRDLYPFLTERQMADLRALYQRGYEATGAPQRDTEERWDRRDRRDRPTWRVQLWDGEVRDARVRVVRRRMILDTVRLSDLEELFFGRGRLSDLHTDFALAPILDGQETMIDFVGEAKARLKALARWQLFLFGPSGDGERRWSRDAEEREFRTRLLESTATRGATFIGERVGLVKFLGDNVFRPSTDARRGRELSVPLPLDDSPISIVGINEDRTTGWTGELELEGGPLKFLFLTHLAAEGAPRRDGRLWQVRLEVPDYDRPASRLEGLFEIEFDRPVPDVLPDERSGRERSERGR